MALAATNKSPSANVARAFNVFFIRVNKNETIVSAESVKVMWLDNHKVNEWLPSYRIGVSTRTTTVRL